MFQDTSCVKTEDIECVNICAQRALITQTSEVSTRSLCVKWTFSCIFRAQESGDLCFGQG